MTKRLEELDIPLFALRGAGALVAATLIAAFLGSYSGVGTVTMPEARTIEMRELKFVSRADQGFDIYDVATDRLAGTVPDQQAGFIRGVLRGLSRERRMSGVDEGASYQLVRAEGGRLSLIDPAMDRRIELRGFGETNFDAFRRLMTLGRETT